MKKEISKNNGNRLYWKEGETAKGEVDMSKLIFEGFQRNGEFISIQPKTKTLLKADISVTIKMSPSCNVSINSPSNLFFISTVPDFVSDINFGTLYLLAFAYFLISIF